LQSKWIFPSPAPYANKTSAGHPLQVVRIQISSSRNLLVLRTYLQSNFVSRYYRLHLHYHLLILSMDKGLLDIHWLRFLHHKADNQNNNNTPNRLYFQSTPCGWFESCVWKRLGFITYLTINNKSYLRTRISY